MGALFRLLLLSWEIVVVISGVSAGCDRVKGTPGDTDCVYSPHNGLFQAAVCMPRKEIETFTSKHFSCRGRYTQYCWYLCTATAGHGGLSACECNPNVLVSGKSKVPLACYFPTGNCSWFTECLGKRVNCSSTIKAATERCNNLDTASQSVSENGQEWVNTTKKCIQNNMIHYLYPQINLACNNMSKIIESSETLCYGEKLYESQFCKLNFWDVVTIHGYLSAFYRNFLLCISTTVLPPWSKLVIFYVKNLPDQDLDEIAGQLGNTLSKKYEWSKAGLDHIAASPARLPVKGQTVPIRVYIYSKTQSSENISEVISEKIKELKMDIADGKMSSLSVAKVGNINITQVVGCKDPQCLSSTFFMLTECSNTTKQLACDILDAHNRDKNITLLDYHVSKEGSGDGADSLSNIKDTCDGRPAKRSNYSCIIKKEEHTAPGDTVCLDELILQYVLDLLNTSSTYTLQINALAGSCHSNASLHYSGMAVDLQLNWSGTSRDPNQTKAYQDACTEAGGWKHNGTHVHCQIVNWKQTTSSQSGDDRCKDIGGICQDKSIACDNGQYRAGLCAGNSDRQCCVPNSDPSADEE
uniref:Uncharacterized protein LOC111136926 n=1 Tax=Crassostrea virginica TaxID=6565 RepID=A0A8B8EV19_CRAVI|nr:uncharacterized protein LOC111136926 [Crassostrea virginica]